MNSIYSQNACQTNNSIQNNNNNSGAYKWKSTTTQKKIVAFFNTIDTRKMRETMRMNRESGGWYINLLSYTNLFAFFNDPTRHDLCVILLVVVLLLLLLNPCWSKPRWRNVESSTQVRVQWPMFILITSNKKVLKVSAMRTAIDHLQYFVRSPIRLILQFWSFNSKKYRN